MWNSTDKGKTWKKTRQLTRNSPRNHNYIRKVVNGQDPFYYPWADGNPDTMSESLLYFGDSKGDVWQLPYEMTGEGAEPVKLNRAKEDAPSSRPLEMAVANTTSVPSGLCLQSVRGGVRTRTTSLTCRQSKDLIDLLHASQSFNRESL